MAEQNDVQKRIDEAVAAEVAKRAALEERIAKMEEEKALTASSDFCKSAGLDATKFAKPILALRKAAPEVAPVIEAELERLAKGLAAAVNLNGKQIAGVGKSGTPAMERLNKAAADIRKARPDLTPEQAMEKAINDNPELYNEVR